MIRESKSKRCIASTSPVSSRLFHHSLAHSCQLFRSCSRSQLQWPLKFGIPQHGYCQHFNCRFVCFFFVSFVFNGCFQLLLFIADRLLIVASPLFAVGFCIRRKDISLEMKTAKTPFLLNRMNDKKMNEIKWN